MADQLTDWSMRRGTPEERFWAKVEKTDDCWLWTGARVPDGYGQISVDGRLIRAHRFAYELLVGPIPSGVYIDHRATCPKNCVNPTHLRPATQKQNMENRSGPQANCKSGVRGVYQRASGSWQATVKHRGQTIYVGCFDTKEEAGAAAQAARNQLFTHNDLDRRDSE